MRFAAVYGAGAVIGFTPREVDQMSMWEFMAAVEGWIKANTSDEGQSAQEKDELWEWLQQRPAVPLTRMQ